MDTLNPKYSVFLQTNRDYLEFSKVMREMIYTATDAEKIVQRYYPEFTINPVLVDAEIAVPGHKKGEKCLIGFNYETIFGYAHYIVYSTIYKISHKYNLKMYFDGYSCFWEESNYLNSFTLNIQRTMEEKTPEQRKNISFCFWDLRLFFDNRFKKTVF